MNVLFFDTSNNWMTVAVYSLKMNHTQRLYLSNSPSAKDSSYKLVGEIEKALGVLPHNKPDAIATCIGPGSFTGIRICVSTARNLSQIWQTPVIGFDSLEVYCRSFRNGAKPPMFVLNARQKKVYAAFLQNNEFHPSMDIHPDTLEKDFSQELQTYQIYTDMESYANRGILLGDTLPLPEATLTHYKEQIMNASLQENHYATLVPNYLRGSYAEEKNQNEKK
ncbi:MAG: tRNA (adenosine(37)-N6)-threonylcarbamoyltransferase complex dimerization subunit type 1 TsaB [Spirochaetota bacterium]